MERVDELAAGLAARMLSLAGVCECETSVALVLPEAAALARSVVVMEDCLVLARMRIAELAAVGAGDHWLIADFDLAQFAACQPGSN